MLSPEIYKSHFLTGHNFHQYLSDFKHFINVGAADKFGTYTKHLPMNWQRTSRLYRHFRPSEDALNLLSFLANPLQWLVVVEPWCGDVSQSLPVMARMAEASNNRINLRVAYRDQNPELMNAHLTNGVSRSIPILIQLDSAFKVLGTWGPRPAEAQALVAKLTSDSATAVNYGEELHRWYAQNKQQAIQSELLALLK